MFIKIFARNIEQTKKKMKAAGRFGSDEYNAFMVAHKDNPGYQVVVTARKGKAVKKDIYKGLTYLYMENYILEHESVDKVEEVINEYRGEAPNLSVSWDGPPLSGN